MPVTVQNTLELAKHLGISKKTLERMRIEGNGPRYSRVGKKIVYAQNEVDEWIKNNTYSSTSEYKQSIH